MKSGKILVVEIGGHSLKGLVVKLTGRRLTVLSQAAVSISEEVSLDINKIGRSLTNLLNELGDYPKKTIVITSQARFFVSSLEIPENVKVPEERIAGAITWEVEPYLDFPVADGMFSHRLCAGKKKTGKIPVVITAIEKSVYADIVSVFKDFDLSVGRVYAPEGAFAFASENNSHGRSAITIHNNGQSLVSAFVNPSSKKPVVRTDRLKPGFSVDALESIPVEPGMPVSGQIMDMMGEYEADAENIGTVILSGESVSVDLVDDLQGDLSADIRLWDISMDLGSLNGKADVVTVLPKFATAMGAAVQELDKTGPPLGLTDRIPVTEKIKQQIHLAPVLALAFVILCFAGHYVYLNNQMTGFAAQLEILNKDKQVYTGLKDERTGMLTRQKDIKSKKKYLKSQLPQQQKNLMAFLTGLPGVVPENLVVTELNQVGSDEFILRGQGIRTAPIGVFAMRLADLDGIKQAKIAGIERIVKNGDTTCLPYEFTIRITMKS